MKKSLTFLFLLTAFCVASVFAQKKTAASENQCRMFETSGFFGEKMSLDIENKEIRDLLNYFTERYGCHFVADDEFAKHRITVKADEIPWNIILIGLLQSENLVMKKVGTFESKPIFRVGDNRTLLKCEIREREIYTEFIKLKNLPVCPNNDKCEQSSAAINYLKETVARGLSETGTIEFDESSQALIITDVRVNLEAIKNLVKIIDTEEFYKESEKKNNKKIL